MVEHADRVITMGCGAEAACPTSFVEAEDWQLEDPKGETLEQVRRIRVEIQDKVVKLLEEIAASQETPNAGD